MPVRIVTDSTCDLPAETIARYGICVAPLYINIREKGYLDGIDITREEFYKQLPKFPVHPTTAVPSPFKFRVLYDALADEGATEIISIHISTSLSAVTDVARMAAQEMTSVPVTVFDSQQVSLGTGFQVEMAAKMAATGCSAKDIIAALNEQVHRCHVFAALDTLEFLKRSGRMSKYAAGLGALLQIKPILTMYNGKPGTERVRTRERATNRLLQMLKAVGPIQRIAIVHTHAPERVAELHSLVDDMLHPHNVISADITPVIGTHIGPGAFGFAVFGA